MAQKTVYDRALDTVRAHKMAGADAFAVAMVSGGSDSCALAYMVADMVAAGELGAAVMLHVNHKLRGEASEGDARFVAKLAEALGLPLFMCEIDVSAIVRQGGNMEAIARVRRLKAPVLTWAFLKIRRAYTLRIPQTTAWRTSICARLWARARAGFVP